MSRARGNNGNAAAKTPAGRAHGTVHRARLEGDRAAASERLRQDLVVGGVPPERIEDEFQRVMAVVDFDPPPAI
jgi:hypothetical protein